MTTTQKPSLFIHVIPVGTSEAQEFALRHNNGQAISGVGVDIELEIFKKVDDDWVEIAEEDDPPTVAWISEELGTIRVSGVETLEVGSYRVRYKLTDAFDKIGYCPNGEKADLWRVVDIPGPA